MHRSYSYICKADYVTVAYWILTDTIAYQIFSVTKDERACENSVFNRQRYFNVCITNLLFIHP